MSETHIPIRLLRMYFPRNWEFSSALSKLQNFGGGLNPNLPLGMPMLPSMFRELWLQQSSFLAHIDIKAVCCESVTYLINLAHFCPPTCTLSNSTEHKLSTQIAPPTHQHNTFCPHTSTTPSANTAAPNLPRQHPPHLLPTQQHNICHSSTTHTYLILSDAT
jgi:hypothetical protein